MTGRRINPINHMKLFKSQRKVIKKYINRVVYLIRISLFGKKDCTKQTKRCRYHSSCCKRNLKTILEYIDKLFKTQDIKYWLDYGTLLGAVRENDLIEYDTDIDLGILYTDKEKFLGLKDKIESDGYFLKKDHSMDFYRIAFSKNNSLHADIFFWKKNSEGILYREQYMKKDDYKGKDFPYSLILETEIREIDGKMYPVPSNPEAFCEFRFGTGWRQRIKYDN